MAWFWWIPAVAREVIAEKKNIQRLIGHALQLAFHVIYYVINNSVDWNLCGRHVTSGKFMTADCWVRECKFENWVAVKKRCFFQGFANTSNFREPNFTIGQFSSKTVVDLTMQGTCWRVRSVYFQIFKSQIKSFSFFLEVSLAFRMELVALPLQGNISHNDA